MGGSPTQGTPAAVATALALLAIGVSIWALRTGQNAQRRIVEIEETRDRKLETESHRANITAEVRQSFRGSYNGFDLWILNHGPAEAHNMTILMDGKPFLEHRAVLRGVSAATELGPNSGHRYPLAITMDYGGPFAIDISWSDDSGVPGRYRTDLTV